MEPLTRTIGVFPRGQLRERAGLFESLAQLFPVEFIESADGRDEGLEAILLLEGTREKAIAIGEAGVPCFAVLSANHHPSDTVHLEHAPVVFQKDAHLHRCFRGQTLMDEGVQEMQQWQYSHEVSGAKVLKKKVALGKLGRPCRNKIHWHFSSHAPKPYRVLVL